jgi:hypothetical protein
LRYALGYRAWFKGVYVRLTVSLLLAAGAAYAFSFAVDLLIGGLIGVYPHTAFLPVVTWSVISGVLLLAACPVVADRLRWLALPYVLFGTLATLGALVGHLYNFGVAGLLFVHAFLIWKAGRQTSSRDSGTRRASFPIGPYHLNTSIDGIADLLEFSSAEYSVMGRQFDGERNYNAAPVEFLGKRWNLMLGTVNRKIYKIAPFQEARSKDEANPIAMATLRYCTEILGKPDSQETGLFVWDTSDGNTILQTAETQGGLAINLFITSREVRNFRRL